MIIGMVRYSVPAVFLNTKNNKTIEQLYEEPYFSTRFDIFCNITLPCFEQQTNKNFILLVYHSNQIPSDKRKLFDDLEKRYLFLKNIYIDDSSMYIPEHLKENNLLTFRIDNDDGIVNDFIEKLQEVKDNNINKELIITIPEFCKIARIDKEEYILTDCNFPSNSMGLAYLSKNNKTIMDLGNHVKAIERFPFISLPGNGGLQVINGYNVANRFGKTEIYKSNKEKAIDFLKERHYPILKIENLPIIHN